MTEKNYHMSLDLTLSVINGKWKSLILCHLGCKPLRNGELMRKISGISQKVLTQQLNELIHDKVVQKITFPGLPLHVEYSLTDEGKSLRKVLIDMSVWGEHHADQLNANGQNVSFLSDNYCGYQKIQTPKKEVDQQLAEQLPFVLLKWILHLRNISGDSLSVTSVLEYVVIFSLKFTQVIRYNAVSSHENHAIH